MRLVLGVDEAGRGPLAGPIAVGIVAVPEGFKVAKEFPGVADSKQLSERERERLYALLKARAADPDSGVSFCVRFGSAAMIDRQGISPVTRAAVARGIRSLAERPERVTLSKKRVTLSGLHVFLDGSLHAPEEYAQTTIVGGDETVPLISLASIAAKVQRDRLMKRLAKLYPEYGFELHKGYGTKAHYEALAKHGPCEIHRASFLRLD